MKCCGHTHNILVQNNKKSERNKRVSLAKQTNKHTHAINEEDS